MKKITNTIVSLSLVMTIEMLSLSVAIAGGEDSSPPTETTDTDSALVSGAEITEPPFSPDEIEKTTNN